jgi:hypothetical protein
MLSLRPLLVGLLLAPLLTAAPARAQQMFGSPGRPGANGWSGRPGENSASQTVTATGAAVSVATAGTDGEAGQNGEQGEPAEACDEPNSPAYDLVGAGGGDGGNAGAGGDGGNAGAVTIQYADQSALRRVYINGRGGRGGYAGYPGGGGEPCTCWLRQWQVNKVTYTCQDGRRGYEGQNAPHGSDGWATPLTLIAQLAPLDPTSPTATLSVPKVEQAPPTLTDNRWIQGRGAAGLLAPGSVVQDAYRLYAGRIVSRLDLVWQAERSVTDLGDVAVNAFLQSEHATVAVPDDVWFDATQTAAGANTLWTVKNVLRQREVAGITLDQLSGSGSGFVAELTDRSGYPDLVATSFYLRYYVRGRIFMRLRYDDRVSPDLVSRNGSTYTVALGRLPIDSSYFAPGDEVEVQLTATRAFAGKSLEVDLDRQGTIGK